MDFTRRSRKRYCCKIAKNYSGDLRQSSRCLRKTSKIVESSEIFGTVRKSLNDFGRLAFLMFSVVFERPQAIFGQL